MSYHRNGERRSRDEDHFGHYYRHHYARGMMDEMDEEDIMMELRYYEHRNHGLDDSSD